MNERAFVIAGDQAAVVANDMNDPRYRAAVHYVPVGVQVPVRSHGDAEMQFMLEHGTLEFMVGGASTMLAAPSLIRVPPDVPDVGWRIAAVSPEPAPECVPLAVWMTETAAGPASSFPRRRHSGGGSLPLSPSSTIQETSFS